MEGEITAEKSVKDYSKKKKGDLATSVSTKNLHPSAISLGGIYPMGTFAHA